MTTIDHQITFEANKKSAIVAIILNLILPGAGYMYCGNVILGLFVLCLSTVALILTLGFAGLIIYPILIIDGALAAGRANRKLAENLQLKPGS